MPTKDDFKFDMEPQFAPMELIDVPKLTENVSDPWFNKTLCKFNSSMLRVGSFDGEFFMHKHDNDDEIFFVLEGQLILETEHGNFTLNKHQGVCIPKGVVHRPVAKQRVVVLMVENADVDPSGVK